MMENLKGALGRYLLPCSMAVALLLGMNSCNLGGHAPDPIRPNAYVTVKSTPSGGVCLVLSPSETLLVTNLKDNPYKGKEVRAFVSYVEDEGAPHDGYSKAVQVHWMDSVRTKNPAPVVDDMSQRYGDDMIQLLNDQVVGIEDGYLTLCMQYVGLPYGGPKHEINLVAGTNPEDPYELQLRHNAFKDPQIGPGVSAMTGYIAFRLKGQLPDTNGKEVTLTVKWRSGMGKDGWSSNTFGYTTPSASDATRGSSPVQ